MNQREATERTMLTHLCARRGIAGAVNRNLLAVAHSEPLWAMYYCRRYHSLTMPSSHT
jgi:hypothetical protein